MWSNNFYRQSITYYDIAKLNSKLGQILYTETALVSTTETGKTTAIASIVIPPGKWILIARAGFATNGTGIRTFNLHTTMGSSGIMVSMNPLASGVSRVTFSMAAEVNEETTYYLNALQTSGTNLAVSASRIDAVQVGI